MAAGWVGIQSQKTGLTAAVQQNIPPSYEAKITTAKAPGRDGNARMMLYRSWRLPGALAVVTNGRGLL
jgi:hypothetical protein